MLVENNSIEFQQNNSLYLQKYCSPERMESAKQNINYNVKENFGESDFSDYEDETSIDFTSFNISDQKHSSDDNFDIDILKMKCKEMFNFSDQIKQIDSMPLDITYKILMMQALKDQILEKLQNQQSFRHLMRKKVSKKQKQNDSNMTKTTAAYSVASTITSIPQQNTKYMRSNTVAEIPQNQYSIGNNTQFTNIMSNTIQNNQEDNAASKRCSIISVKAQNIDSAKKEIVFGSPINDKNENKNRNGKRNTEEKFSKQQLLEQCCAYQKDIKKLEKALIPKKNERNRISEKLEDSQEDLIVMKQYMRELMNTEDQKQALTENLMKQINQMSRKGLSMNNRENNTSMSLNNSRLSSSFVEEAVSKIKSFKDFFKVKIFSSKDNNQRGNTQNQLPINNRILDFN